MSVLGSRVDLSQLKVDAYLIAGSADHITPWQNCYRSTALLGGDTRFVLSTSGHIAALVNPPTNTKASYQTNEEHLSDPQQWQTTAQTHRGSWWPDYGAWLAGRCGPTVPAADLIGEPLAPAPGTYVFEK
jgi:polyhydroxyalkanoate synthase